ncbi:MAG: serine/threonine protein kinase, partial [Myxococcales bacterium]|nr:serine/threonine protein kinase [Myxococcales bacterium]
QFSFCVALWEALYDQRPFAGRTMVELSAAVAAGKLREPPADTRIPGFLQAALRRGLSVDPDARWPDLTALLTELERDPSMGRRRLLVGGGLAASLLGALAVGPALAEHHQAEDIEICPAADARLEGVWDLSLHHQVHQAFAGDSSQVQQAVQINHFLDDYAADWLAMHKDACEDTNVRRELSPAILDKRMQCLEERRMALGAVSHQLAGGPQPQLEPLVVIAGLPSIERCGDLDYLEAQAPMPDDRALAASVNEVRARLAELRAQVDAGAPHQSLPALESLAEEAVALGYAPLDAQVLTELAFAQAGMGDPRESQRRLEEAVVASIRTGQDELAGRAGTEAPVTFTYQRGELGVRLEVVDAGMRDALAGLFRPAG